MNMAYDLKGPTYYAQLASTRYFDQTTLHNIEGASYDAQPAFARYFDQPASHSLGEPASVQLSGPLSSRADSIFLEVRARKGGGGGVAKGGGKAGKAGKAGKGGAPVALECPKVDGRKCGGYGDCDENVGSCDCFKGFYGPSCMDDPLAHIAFDLDCARMTRPYVAQVIKAVTGGACTEFRLTWERLAYHTCTALPGVLCTLYSREQWCSHDPDGACGETLCNSFLANYCQDAFEDVSKLRRAAVQNPEDKSPEEIKEINAEIEAIAEEGGYGNESSVEPHAGEAASLADDEASGGEASVGSGSESASGESGSDAGDDDSGRASGESGSDAADDGSGSESASGESGAEKPADDEADGEAGGEEAGGKDVGGEAIGNAGQLDANGKKPFMAQLGALPGDAPGDVPLPKIMQIKGPLPGDGPGDGTGDIAPKGAPLTLYPDTTSAPDGDTADALEATQAAAYDADVPEPISTPQEDSVTHETIASGSSDGDPGKKKLATSWEFAEDRKLEAQTPRTAQKGSIPKDEPGLRLRFREQRGQSRLQSSLRSGVTSQHNQDTRKRGSVRPNARAFTWDHLMHMGELNGVLPHVAAGQDAHADDLRAMRQAGQIRTFDAARGLHNIRAIAATMPEAALLQQGAGEEAAQYAPAVEGMFDKLYNLQRK
jgi:hypothetical protein